MAAFCEKCGKGCRKGCTHCSSCERETLTLEDLEHEEKLWNKACEGLKGNE